MSEILCFDCQNVFDAQQGHHCVHGWHIPKNDNFPTKVQRIDCESQFIFSATAKKRSYPTSVINELGKENLDVFSQANITDLQINNDFELSQSLECASEKMEQKFMVCNSVQTYVQVSAKKETDVPGKSVNHPVSRAGYNLPLESGIRKSRIPGDNCAKDNIISQFSNMEKSSMLNSENNKRDFIKFSMHIDSLMFNKKRQEISSKEHQQRSNVEIEQSLSQNGRDNSEERNRNAELKTKKTVPNNEMVSKGNQQSKISHDFSVPKQIVHDSVQEYELENMSCPIAIEEYKSNMQLNSRDMSTVEMLQDCTFGSSLNSHENELSLGNNIYHEDQNQIAPAQILNQHTLESVEPCSADAIAAVIGPSSSVGNERTCSICHEEFSSIYHLKLHYKIHSGPFICNICQIKYTSKRSLSRHKRLHH